MSKVTLLIQASNGVPVLALARDGAIRFDSSEVESLAGSREYRLMLETGLTEIGATLKEITRIGCDIGPGGLGVTRTAAAFANGLGFTLGIPVVALPAFALLGAEAFDGHTPVALLRRAGRPYVHFGIFRDGTLIHYEHCLEEDALKQLENLDKYNLAGNIPVEGAAPPKTNTAKMATLLSLVDAAPKPAANARAYPIVEVLS